jgi:hypothetical protein
MNIKKRERVHAAIAALRYDLTYLSTFGTVLPARIDATLHGLAVLRAALEDLREDCR